MNVAQPQFFGVLQRHTSVRSLVLDPGETSSKLNQALNAGLMKARAPESFGGGQLELEAAIQGSGNIPEYTVADIISSLSDKMPGRWEYTVLYANKKGYFSNAISGISKNFEEQLSKLDGWGWELVTVTPVSFDLGQTATTIWIFKRPKP